MDANNLPDIDPTGTRWEAFVVHSPKLDLLPGFEYFGYAFHRATEELVGVWAKQKNDILGLPIAYLGRHAIELSLKSLWLECERRGMGQGNFPRDHPLMNLWRPLRAFCQKIHLFEPADAFVDQFEGLLTYLDDIDARSTTFRYPPKAGSISIDVVKLARAIDMAETFFFGADAMMGQYDDMISSNSM